RNDNILVYNKPFYELYVIPGMLESFDTLELCQILDISKEFFVEKLNEAKDYSTRRQSRIYGPFSQKDVIILKEKMHKYKGFFIQKKFERAYTVPSAAHILGYLREVDQTLIDTNEYYNSGDIFGVAGIERSYENYLRGEKGVHYYLVDANNEVVEKYKKGKYDTIARVGQNIISTIDIDLQRYGEMLMQNKRGAIVAIEPKTGEILAIVSAPAYNPNSLNLTNLKQNYANLLLDEDRPLFNRALGSATSPPGSTFKVIDALIGLNEGVITTKSTISCNGGFRVSSGHVVACHHFSPVGFYYSISGSCNSYYCEVFTRIINNKKYASNEEAYTAWYNQLHKFGIGVKLGVDLPGENAGTLYSADRFNKIHGKGKWGAYRIISLAIGQGEMGITPLQLANVAAIIANKGYYIIPHVVKKIESRPFIDKKYLKKNYIGIDSSYFTPVIEGMEQVVLHGTAHWIRLDSISQCGKTGTAQNPHGDYNSVFIAFAPKDDPKIALGVYIENGGYGSSSAAPIASLMIEKYLADSITRTYLEQYIVNKNLMDRGQRTDK
ncbi:MAG: penicillin-binding transpeptidase domain-containing protein, partial [Bacteroidota bacterium]|nr:penicillin-binding transpeptidase domain-containing protein [Bacteroidota bacterium]